MLYCQVCKLRKCNKFCSCELRAVVRHRRFIVAAVSENSDVVVGDNSSPSRRVACTFFKFHSQKFCCEFPAQSALSAGWLDLLEESTGM